MWPRLLLWFSLSLLLGCAGRPAVNAPNRPRNLDLRRSFERAMHAEANDALAGQGYLDTIDAAVSAPDQPWALAAVLASLDALVWRHLAAFRPHIDHAIAHRSAALLGQTSARLRAAWTGGQASPPQRVLIARALHALALRVGATKAAAKWRRRAGCLPAATVVGPVAWPPLSALDAPTRRLGPGALPATFAGVAPFARRVVPEQLRADGCHIDINATSPLSGLRLVVVDVINPQSQPIYVVVQSSSAARVELGAQMLVQRAYAASSGVTTVMGRARARAGRVRLVVRVAQNRDSRAVAIMVLDSQGHPLQTRAPGPGAQAAAAVERAQALPITPTARTTRDLPLAMAALLAAGQPRRALDQLAQPFAPSVNAAGPLLDLLRIRALETAQAQPRNQRLLLVSSAAERVRATCPDCWEGRIAAARSAEQRRGYSTGAYARLAELGVTAADASWIKQLGPMELSYLALGANSAKLHAVARLAYDALARQHPRSALLADVDAAIFYRTGAAGVRAACEGGTDRSSGRCVHAHLRHSELADARAEMQRLRQLRGDPSLLRELELRQLLLRGRVTEALRIYDALPAGRRSLAWLGVERSEATKARWSRDMLSAQDAPSSYQPLARLWGVVHDESFAWEQAAARLVARDRQHALLPGAATAVLQRTEHYRLSGEGLLHFWIHDLRRMSGTQDVATGASHIQPLLEGRRRNRTLRRRIYKRDGRVLDPDPTARGTQASTELAQLEAGDYVETIVEGWALPGADGQLVVDTPDLLPLRTSVRRAVVRFDRPRALSLALWSHPLLGAGQSRQSGGQITTEWRLRDRQPRRIEEGTPPLEARVGISFGTDSYPRIARSLGERFRSLDEHDSFMHHWVREAVGRAKRPPRQQLARLLEAVGKAVRRADGYALSDAAGSHSGGPQRETARHIIERGSGSRSWVVHRALRELGLSSRIAVAETRPFSAAPGFPPHVGRFTHPLVQVELDDGPLWIDADVPGAPLPPGRVSPELRGRKALLANGEMLIVQADEVHDRDDINIELKLDPNGDAAGHFDATLHGRQAQQLADALETTVGSRRTALLRNVVLAWLPWADVRSVSLAAKPGSWRIAVHATIAIPGYLLPENRDASVWTLPGLDAIHTAYPSPRTSRLTARYAGRAVRTTALAIDQPLLYRVHRRIEIPPTMAVSQLAPELQVRADAVNAERRVVQHGMTIVDELRLDLPIGVVKANAFAAFVVELRRVDAGFLQGVRIERLSR